MREAHVSHARMGELELRLDPLPPPPSSESDYSPITDPDEDERRSLETLLHSSGVDPTVFHRMLKRVA